MNRELHAWYRARGRHDLPWRLTRDPYAVLVSEVMLQQTQVERVIPHYHRWLARWPGVGDLADASPADVIREWAGLGYNRRALYLHGAAVAVVERHGGTFPHDLAALRGFPGIGPYTAAAVASFAFDQPVPVADTNIARVVARARLGMATYRDAPAGAIARAARDLLPARGVRDHSLALMDLGALTCRTRDPLCNECPIRQHCAWLANGRPAQRQTAPRTTPRFESTARYARGRIIAALRQHPSLDEATLATHLPAPHRAKLDTYLAALARDGLLICAGEGWSLPE